MTTNDDSWKGPTEKEWLERIAKPSTPVGETIPWIKNALPHKSKDCFACNHPDMGYKHTEVE
jgi:hypothetical protein